MIAGGNLLRLLLKDVKTDEAPPIDEIPAVEPPEDDDPIVATMREGKPLTDEFIFDAHGHIGHEGSMGIARMQLRGTTATASSARWTGWGSTAASSAPGAASRTATRQQRHHAAAVERHPERLLAFGTINPRYPEAAAEEMRRVFAAASCGRVQALPAAPDGAADRHPPSPDARVGRQAAARRCSATAALAQQSCYARSARVAGADVPEREVPARATQAVRGRWPRLLSDLPPVGATSTRRSRILRSCTASWSTSCASWGATAHSSAPTA
jgi:hypothetical protein